jgi:hypothetical protein
MALLSPSWASLTTNWLACEPVGAILTRSYIQTQHFQTARLRVFAHRYTVALKPAWGPVGENVSEFWRRASSRGALILRGVNSSPLCLHLIYRQVKTEESGWPDSRVHDLTASSSRETEIPLFWEDYQRAKG